MSVVAVPFVSAAIVSAAGATKIASVTGSFSSRDDVKSSSCPASTESSGLIANEPRPMKTASTERSPTAVTGKSVPSASVIVALPACNVTLLTWIA